VAQIADGARSSVRKPVGVDTPHRSASSVVDSVVAVEARAAAVVQAVVGGDGHGRPGHSRLRQQDAVRRRLAARNGAAVEAAALGAVTSRFRLLRGAVAADGEPQLVHHVRPNGTLQSSSASNITKLSFTIII